MSRDTTHTGAEGAPPGARTALWTWATEHGQPESAPTEQLVGWLSRGELPPHTLVWRPGWGEWLPAVQVLELAAAFPDVTRGSRRVARAASGAQGTPPPVPVAHYPRLRLLARDVAGQSTRAGAQSSVVPVPSERRALRDLDHLQRDLVTSQVPVAAMLEAARAMQGQSPATRDQTMRPPSVQAMPVQGMPQPVAGVRTLVPLAVELGYPALLESGDEPSANAWRSAWPSGRWLWLAVLVGVALGLLAAR
jgi:hypothetical protein